MNPILAIIITNIIWGMASPIFKFALTNIPPFTLAFIRFFFAGLIFVPFMTKKWQAITKRDFFQICLSAFFGISINISFFFLGIQRTESINAPIIASAGPLFIFLFAVLFLKEKPKLKVFAGMLLSLIGVLLIILSPMLLDGKNLMFGEILGNIFIVIATIGAVVNTIVNKNVLSRVNPYVVTCISFLFGSLTFFPFTIYELQSWSFQNLNIHGFTGIIFGILFSSAIAYFLFNYAMTKISAQEVGLFTYIDPVAGILLAIPLVQEYPNLYFIIGSVLIFGGIYIAENRIHWHPFNKLNLKFKI